MTNFSAAPQMLGYVYQIRYALYRILSKSSDTEMYLEDLDDIHFSKDGNPIELIQAKHHSTPANLTDSSSDLWNSIRIWSHRFKNNEIDSDIAELNLVTNGLVGQDSVAYYLSAGTRDVKKAIDKLDQIAVSSTNASLKSCFEKYNSLNQEEKGRLFSCVNILSGQADVVTIRQSIQDRLHLSVRPEFLVDFVDRLEGWWFSRAINALSEEKLISSKEVNAQVFDLSEEYRQDSLPIHDFNEQTPGVNEVNDQDRGFIEQLRIIKVGQTRITKAVSDYYRAFSQRSKWLRNGNLHIGELESYETRLIDEWERIFLAAKDEISSAHTEQEIESMGRQIFNRIEISSQLNIRPRATEPFIMRGTYHSLANQGHVGWHPNFKEKLQELFNKALERVNSPNGEQNP